MLLLGHSGIALGIAALLNGAVSRCYSLEIRENKPSKQDKDSDKALPTSGWSSLIRPFSFTSLGTRLDIRLLLVGSLLPDIIDKPLGQFFFRETFNNGRIFCHTLLFLILTTLAGYYLYHQRQKTWLLVLSFGTLIHLILDEMWLTPKTLLWPLYGLAFERIDITDWMSNILHALFADPGTYVPEVVGLMILLAFVVMLVRRKKVYSFLTRGHLGNW